MKSFPTNNNHTLQHPSKWLLIEIAYNDPLSEEACKGTSNIYWCDSFYLKYFKSPFFFPQTQETNSLINQILEVQPRMAGSSGGKTNDEIVNELAESILNKIPDKLDIDKALPVIFEVKKWSYV